MKFQVYFTKFENKFTMLYGTYESHDAASAAIKEAKVLNNMDYWYVKQA